MDNVLKSRLYNFVTKREEYEELEKGFNHVKKLLKEEHDAVISLMKSKGLDKLQFSYKGRRLTLYVSGVSFELTEVLDLGEIGQRGESDGTVSKS